MSAACTAQETSVNNLRQPTGYQPSVYGSIPHYTKIGSGGPTLILIPGMGLDGSAFKDFMDSHKHRYTMYAITIPGYGDTPAPPDPPIDASYGDQYWNRGILEGIVKLIEEEHLNKPVLVGHFVQGTQLALRMAIDHPGMVGKVVILGGPARFVYIDRGTPKRYPLRSTIAYIDTNTAPKWFKTISKYDFDAGNYLPEVYSLDSTRASVLWKMAAAVPLHVAVRYLCEFFASDVTLELGKITCPVLVLRAGFSRKVLEANTNNYVKPQFIDTWADARNTNPLISVKDIPNAASCVWMDSPDTVNAALREFLGASVGGFHPGPVRGEFDIKGEDAFEEKIELQHDGRWVPSFSFHWNRRSH